MADRRIIDMHAHIFPEKIVDKAVESICSFYDLPIHGVGTTGELLNQAKQSGVERILVHSTATKPEQVKSINNYIINETKRNKEFIGFATLHPNFENVEEEAERVISEGLKGIKLHPDFQRFNLDDKSAYNIYTVCSRTKLPVLFHIGDYRQSYSSPERLARILDKFPDLKVIAAHLGGWSVWENGYEVLEASDNLYFDTSSSLYDGGIDKEMVYKFIEKHGVDKFLFGSDYPMWELSAEIEKIKELNLTEDEKERIFHKNAERFLGIVTDYS